MSMPFGGRLAIGMYVFQTHMAHAATPVRIVDVKGASNNVGALQVLVGGEFGTVSGLNGAAADVACRELGYDYGVPSTSPCGAYGATNLCGAPGTPVAAQNLACSGGELSITECMWSVPSGAGLSHGEDSVVYCGSVASSTAEGSVRLLSADGAPSLSGDGIAEVFLDGAWSPVCGMSSGAASVLCKAAGFAGTASGTETARSMKSLRVGDLRCSGSEATVLDCTSLRGEDVYCASSEASLVHCA